MKRATKTTSPNPSPVCPCKTCTDNANGRRECGVCNNGLGICEACMEYHKLMMERDKK